MEFRDTFRAEIQDLCVTNGPLDKLPSLKGSIAEGAGGVSRIDSGPRTADNKAESVENRCEKKNHESHCQIGEHGCKIAKNEVLFEKAEKGKRLWPIPTH